MDKAAQPVPSSFCPLCFGKYGIPKMLPCGHTFCKDCIQSMIKRSMKQCPKCKKIFKLPGSGNTEEFPTNYDLLSAIDEMRYEEDRDATNGSNDEEESDQMQMECNIQCVSHGMPYEFFCDTCSEQTCNNCLLDKHKPSKHKITTKTDYLEVQSKNVQKLAVQLNILLSSQNNFKKQLADADTKCQQEAKKLEEQIMEDLETKIKRQREEAEKMIKQVSAETQQKRKRLKEIQEEQNWLIAKTKEHQQSNNFMNRAIRKKCVFNPSTLKEIQMKTDKISKQTDKLRQSNDTVQTGLNLTFEKQKHKTPYLGLLKTNEGLFRSLTRKQILLFIFTFTLTVIFVKWFWRERDEHSHHRHGHYRYN